MSDFDQNWKNFLESFDEAFDTDELNEKISEIVVKEHPDATPEEKMNFQTNIYQRLRTEALIKNVLMNLSKLTKDLKQSYQL